MYERKKISLKNLPIGNKEMADDIKNVSYHWRNYIQSLERTISNLEIEQVYKVNLRRNTWGDFQGITLSGNTPRVMLEELRDECIDCSVPYWVINALNAILQEC
jgi:hypothetical protein